MLCPFASMFLYLSFVLSSDVEVSLLRGVRTANYFMATQNAITFTLMTVLQGAVRSSPEVGPCLSLDLM